MEQNLDRFIKICNWATKRYSENGYLIIQVGRKYTKYTRIERAAWKKYIKNG